MQTLIFEPTWEGHRLDYVARVLRGLIASGAPVTLALSAYAPQQPEFQVHLAPLLSANPGVKIDLSTDYMPEGARALRTALPLPSLLRQSVLRTNADWVYLPTVDGMAQVAGLQALTGWRKLLPSRIESEALIMRGGFAYPQNLTRRLRVELAWLLAASVPWSVLYTIDPLVFAPAQRRLGAHRLRLMPDPVETEREMTATDARRVLQIAEDGRYMGTAGQLDERKGTDQLVRAFAAAVPTLAATDRLLLVGRQAPFIRDLLARQYEPLVRARRIISLDRYVSNDELGRAMRAMDVVCTPYPRHIGSASIVIRAAAAGRPVLGSRYGWIGDIVPRFALGRTCNVADINEFADAIRVALIESATFAPGEGHRRFVAFHSQENFAATWTKRLRERLGLAPLPGLRDWAWVEECGVQ